MLNLRCTHCGAFNPITSEYQTFCQHCNKKLTNNFPDWHKLNPEKSFDDFKQLFGVEEVMPVARKGRSRFFTKDGNGKTKIIWGALIGFFVTTAIITFTSNKVTNFIESVFFQKTTPEYFLTKTWNTSSYGSYGLSMATPFTLRETDMHFPKQLVDMTEYLKSFQSDKSLPVMVMINVIKYKAGLPVNLQNGANGAVNEMKSQPEVSDFTYSEIHEKVSDFPAILQTGSYSTSTDKVGFKDLIMLKSHIFMQVTILYEQSDSTGNLVADKIVQSVKINNNL